MRSSGEIFAGIGGEIRRALNKDSLSCRREHQEGSEAKVRAHEAVRGRALQTAVYLAFHIFTSHLFMSEFRVSVRLYG
jgi:hypothetical protein